LVTAITSAFYAGKPRFHLAVDEAIMYNNEETGGVFLTPRQAA
jgi:hypothetical protein